eukprot:317004-Chlamydomonas_euryale.AAC.8
MDTPVRPSCTGDSPCATKSIWSPACIFEIAFLPCLDVRRAWARVSGDWPLRPNRCSAKPDARRSAPFDGECMEFFSILHALVFIQSLQAHFGTCGSATPGV